MLQNVVFLEIHKRLRSTVNSVVYIVDGYKILCHCEVKVLKSLTLGFGALHNSW
jgi:hypothetical protein